MTAPSTQYLRASRPMDLSSPFAAAVSYLNLRTLETMHNEEVISFIGFHVHSRLSSPRGSTRTPSHDTLRQACEVPERHLRPKTL